MKERMREDKEFQEAKKWLEENGQLKITENISENIVEYRVVYLPNLGKPLDIVGADLVQHIIGIYREMK